MEFRFVAPSLYELDVQNAELLACCIWSDVRPVRGCAGLLDWRLSGKLSTLNREAFLGGAQGECVLVPGRPKLPFEKVLVFGLGPRCELTDEAFSAGVRHISRTLEGLHVARAVVELPGRGDGSIAASKAAELLAAAVETDAHDTWWLVEDDAGERVIRAKLDGDRRVKRRA